MMTKLKLKKSQQFINLPEDMCSLISKGGKLLLCTHEGYIIPYIGEYNLKTGIDIIPELTITLNVKLESEDI